MKNEEENQQIKSQTIFLIISKYQLFIHEFKQCKYRALLRFVISANENEVLGLSVAG